MDEKGSVFDVYVDAPAIRELGPLFKLTCVYLWDDGRKTGGESCKGTANGGVGSETVCNPSDGDELLEEDADLAKEMSALGLPFSFKTAKENNKITSKGRTKGRQSKVCRRLQEGELVENDVSIVFHGNSSDCVSSKIAQDASSVYHVTDDLSGLYHFSGQRWLSSSGSEIDHVVTKELVGTEMSDLATSCTDIESTITEDTSYNRLIIEADNEIADEDRLSSQFPSTDSGRTDNSFALQCTSLGNHVEVNMEINNSNQEHMSTEKLASPSGSEMFHHDDIGDYQCKGDWLMFWDAYYQRHYFYNVKNQVSTWLEPPGFDHLLYHESTGTDGKLEPTNSASLAQCNSCSEIADPIQDHVDSFKDIYEKHGSVDQSSGDVLRSTKLILASRNSCSELANTIQDRVDSSREILEEHGVAGQPSDEILHYSGITMSRLEDGISKLSCRNEIEEMDQPQSVEDRCSEMPEWFDRQENGIGMEASILAEGHSFPVECRICTTDDLIGQSTARKRKKKVRKPHSQKKVLQDHEELSIPLDEEYSAIIEKYWLQRYILFSRFDSGVKMDEEGWFSVTPETIAKHHAFRCTGGVVVDGFTGVGGNAIHFAQRRVIAVDIDPKRIEYAHHNAIIYEVVDQIDFIKGDFFNLASKLKADTVFLSPPWGGPDYSKVKKYDLKTMLKPHDGFFLFHTARKVASEVVMFLPKNVDLNQLAEISLSVQPPWVLEDGQSELSKIACHYHEFQFQSNHGLDLDIRSRWSLPSEVATCSVRGTMDVERNYLNSKLKAVTAYFTRQERGDGNCITREGGPIEELSSTV